MCSISIKIFMFSIFITLIRHYLSIIRVLLTMYHIYTMRKSSIQRALHPEGVAPKLRVTPAPEINGQSYFKVRPRLLFMVGPGGGVGV